MINLPKTRRESEIWEVCDALYIELEEDAQGITGDKITTMLLEFGYKKGSPNEIYRYRQTWKEARGIDKVGISYQPMEISDPLSRAVQLVKEEIEKEARAEIDELKANYAAKLKSLEESQQLTQAELLSFIDKHDEVTLSFNHARAQAEKLTELNKSVADDNRLLTQQNTFLQEQLTTHQTKYEQTLSQLQALVSAQQELHTEQLSSLQNAWQQSISDYKELMESQRHKYIVEIENLKAEAEQATQKLQIVESEKLAIQHTLSQMKQHQQQNQTQFQAQLAMLGDKFNQLSDVISLSHENEQGAYLHLEDKLDRIIAELKKQTSSPKKENKTTLA